MKRIVIVGATSGIGLETARLCIRQGWRVGAAGRRREALDALRAEAPEQVEVEALDINRDDAPEHLARLIERLGGMDIYLHSSGIGSRNTERRLSAISAPTEAGIWPSSARSPGPGDSGRLPPTRRPSGCRTPT